MEQAQQIENQIKSLREITNTSYQRPVDKTKEYIVKLHQNPDALLYLVRDRGFNLETIKHFKLGLSERGDLVIPVYKNNQLIDYKFRTLPPREKGFSRTPNSETWLFNEDGLREAKIKKEIYILESETDCITLWQNGFKNAVSLVGGANHIGKWINELNDIPQIYINLDSDPAGQKAARQLAERIGLEKCINVVLPVKDANDFFKKYTIYEFSNILKNSKKFQIKDVVTLDYFLDELKQNKTNKKDFQFGYKNLDSITGGFNKANTIIVAALSNHGKTHTMLNIALNLCYQNVPVMYIPLEDRPLYLSRRIINIFTRNEVSMFLENDWEIVKQDVSKLPFYMYIGQEKFNLDIFKKIVEVGRRVHNIEIFIIDNIQMLNVRSWEIDDEITYITKEIIETSRLYNVAIFVIAHVRKKQADYKEQERKYMPGMESIKGSSTLYQDAHMVLMLFQTREFDKTILKLSVQKNREGGKTFGDKPLLFEFNEYTGTIDEYQTQQSSTTSIVN